MLRAILHAALLAILVWGGPAFAEEPPPPGRSAAYPADLKPDHWAYDVARRLAQRGILKGFPDSTFRGKEPVNRYQLAIAIDKAVSQLETRLDRIETRPSAPVAAGPRAAPVPGSARADAPTPSRWSTTRTRTRRIRPPTTARSSRRPSAAGTASARATPGRWRG